jgi:myotubularin-related protein 9
MEFVDLILIHKLDGVVMHGPFQKPVDGTLCITGHHLILSTRKEGVDELWVITIIISLLLLTLSFSILVTVVHKWSGCF